jgi:hypothetical protein
MHARNRYAAVSTVRSCAPLLLGDAEVCLPQEWLVGKDAETHFCKYQSYHSA